MKQFTIHNVPVTLEELAQDFYFDEDDLAEVEALEVGDSIDLDNHVHLRRVA